MPNYSSDDYRALLAAISEERLKAKKKNRRQASREFGGKVCFYPPCSRVKFDILTKLLGEKK